MLQPVQPKACRPSLDASRVWGSGFGGSTLWFGGLGFGFGDLDFRVWELEGLDFRLGVRF